MQCNLMRLSRLALSAPIIAVALLAHAAQALTVDEAMDAIVSRLYASRSLADLRSLDEAAIMAMLEPEEREALTTRHVHFEANVPVLVSVMRHTGQATVPFWLEEAGFEKTDLTVTNTENWVYEVWQREYPAGFVGLGINGFDKHRPHYFVAVAPQNPDDDLELANRFPSAFSLGAMHEGAFVYHDWSSLFLKEVPDSLEGHLLLTTIRGRARTAHLIGGFRETPYPSSETPDQVTLSWTGDPKTTQTVQWRTSTAIDVGTVRFRVAHSESAWSDAEAGFEVVEDRFLANDRYCHRFAATITGLEPGTSYEYQVARPGGDAWTEPAFFETAPAEETPFDVIVFGDTQSIEPWAPIVEAAMEHYPDAAFQMIAGDLVGTGQYRDDWDRFFVVAEAINRQWPLMPALGNHDVIDGLGAAMWQASFALPTNGPEQLESERVYSFEYGNALFVVLDSGLPIVAQAAWLEEQLATSDADWKIAMFHFPPYNYEHPYPKIESLWGYLFDKYEVDIAFEGHIHYYMRSKPIYGGEPQPEDGRGTRHIITIAIPNREATLPPAPYAANQFTGIAVYNALEFRGDTLRCIALDAEQNVLDAFTITKTK